MIGNIYRRVVLMAMVLLWPALVWSATFEVSAPGQRNISLAVTGNGGARNSRGAGAVLGAERGNASLGTPDGTGTEKGLVVTSRLQKTFVSNWWLPKNKISRPDLETKIRVVYDAAGNLKHKEIVKSSGDKAFDQSVEEAVQKSSKLPQPLPAPFDGTVIFNVKELYR